MSETSGLVDTPVVVLGMHRSGTSALAKVLRRLGLWMGTEPNVTRRTEHALAQECSQRLLNGFGGHWSAPPELPAGWTTDPVAIAVDSDARAAVADLSGHGPFAWKDPRTSLTFDFWRERLPGEPIAVISYRHPLEVAASLDKRNSFGPGHVVALWERYNQALLASAAGLRTIVVAYADLARDPVTTLAAVHRDLAAWGVHLDGTPEDAALGIEADRRHHVAEDLPDATTTPQQRALWDALCGLASVHERFEPPVLPTPHAASSELLAQRAASIRLQRDLDAARADWRSRRALVRQFSRRLRGAP